MLPAGRCSVLIAGGGPCGLMLANELGRRAINLVLVDAKPTTALSPQANATQARTMEHFRRLGFADEIRGLGLPPDFPTDIAYFTRFAGYELARLRLPSANEARNKIAALSGSWSAAELPHRVSQKYVEAALRKHAQRLPSASLNYGWRVTDFADEGPHVKAVIERTSDRATRRITADYLVGADGPRSFVREQLGFAYQGQGGVVRDFMGGCMYAIYLRSPTFYKAVGHAPAWMNVTFNRERRAFMAAVDGAGEFAFHTQLRAHENPNAISERDALGLFQAAVGASVPAELLAFGTWTAGHTLVANGFQKGRVFLAGDAAHLFTPTGGLGYNTAVDDAVNLGWKLAAAVKGQAGPSLLASYEAERRPVAIRNTGFARDFADSLGLVQPAPEIEDDSPAGQAARHQAGSYLERHARAEFNIPGITFGARYDASPVIVSDGTSPPEDAANVYIPTACPGGRAPHVWLGEKKSLYDAFGFEWTLLRLDDDHTAGSEIEAAAAKAGIELRVVDLHLEEARDVYGTKLALIRPDQIVAWRGESADNAEQLIETVTGRHGRIAC